MPTKRKTTKRSSSKRGKKGGRSQREDKGMMENVKEKMEDLTDKVF